MTNRRRSQDDVAPGVVAPEVVVDVVVAVGVVLEFAAMVVVDVVAAASVVLEFAATVVVVDDGVGAVEGPSGCVAVGIDELGAVGSWVWIGSFARDG